MIGSTASKITAKESIHPIIFMHFTPSTVSFKKMQSKKGKQDVIKKIGFPLLSDNEKIAPSSSIENNKKNLSILQLLNLKSLCKKTKIMDIASNIANTIFLLRIKSAAGSNKQRNVYM
ncbi:hypothetical protein [Treponema sp. UBA7567]|uniref:hypothetical protein n=1 Tax=Treponema sp. UBA7567 TaxID=1947748 RepID=UPI0025E861D8|nr:hypothetical protein [Treponema sp. UBA7567]